LDHIASADEQQTSGCVQKNFFLIRKFGQKKRGLRSNYEFKASGNMPGDVVHRIHGALRHVYHITGDHMAELGIDVRRLHRCRLRLHTVRHQYVSHVPRR